MKHNSTILIVDDEEVGRDVLESLLIGRGYTLAFAGDGAEALAKAADLTPDLILLDVMMPGMDGYEVCRRLRADPFLAEVPIIMVTALDNRDSRLRGIEAGADDFVSKPFDRVELRARVATITRLNRYSRLLVANRQLESKIKQLSALYVISSALNSSIDMGALLKSTIRQTKELLNVERASILLWDQQREELSLPIFPAEGMGSGPEKHHFPVVSDVAHRVFCEGRPVLVPDVGMNQVPCRENCENRDSAVKSILCVPLRGKEGVLGVFEAVNKIEEEFTEDDQHIFETVADNIAVSIEKANLYQDLQKAEALLRIQNVKLEQTVDALQTEISERKQVEEALRKTCTELEEMQQQLIQSEKLAALGRFSAGITHEIKNPLAIILSGMEFLEMKLTNADADTKMAIEKIQKSTLRADDILRNLLKFARPSELKLEKVKPDSLVNDTLSFFKYSAPSNNIEIQTQFLEEDIYIEIDMLQIQQVLFNLLMNSVEAISGEGKIQVKTCKTVLSEERPCCAIEILDTGEGISKDDLSKLFEPFHTTKRDKKGTGLGLSISKMIVDNHGGDLVIDSESGKGTAARVILPLAQGEMG